MKINTKKLKKNFIKMGDKVVAKVKKWSKEEKKTKDHSHLAGMWDFSVGQEKEKSCNCSHCKRHNHKEGNNFF